MEDSHSPHFQPAHRKLVAPGNLFRDQVIETMQRMAPAIVDEQNAGDTLYRNMAPNFDDSVAYFRLLLISFLKDWISRTGIQSQFCMRVEDIKLDLENGSNQALLAEPN